MSDFPRYCTYQNRVVDDARCLQCWLTPIRQGVASVRQSSDRRMDCCAANLKPIGFDQAPVPEQPITAMMLAELNRGQLIAAVANCLMVAARQREGVNDD